MFCALLLAGCAVNAPNYTPPQAAPPPPTPTPAPIAHVSKPKPIEKVVKASWYGPGMEGRRTANGERFSSAKLTAAARNLPLGSRVVVTNVRNGRSIRVRINDCGPLKRGRKLDLSKAAAARLGIIHEGHRRREN